MLVCVKVCVCVTCSLDTCVTTTLCLNEGPPEPCKLLYDLVYSTSTLSEGAAPTYIWSGETAANSNEDLGHVATASELRSAPCPTGGSVACADRPRWCAAPQPDEDWTGWRRPCAGRGALQRSPATGRPSRPACGVRGGGGALTRPRGCRGAAAGPRR